MPSRTRKTTNVISNIPENIREIDSNPRNVLQDITERFVPDQFTPEPIDTPTVGRIKRKPKAPIGTLAAKLRLAKSPTTAFITSSLPPSSPPSASSTYVEGEDEQVYHQQGLEPHFAGMSEGAPSPNQSLSDPFGFFAVEKKLKAKRDLNNVTRPLHRAPLSIDTNLPQSLHHEHSSDSDGTPVDDHHATLHPNGSNNDVKTDYGSDEQDRVTPPTPHKHIGKRRVAVSPARSSAGVYSPNTGSLPSTPSPLKSKGPTARKRLVKGRSTEDEITDEEGWKVEEGVHREEKNDKERNGKGKARQAKKPRGSGDPVQPLELARSLEALLPKRPVRTRDKSEAGKGKKGKVVALENEEGRSKGTRKNKGKDKAGVKGKVRGKTGHGEGSGEEIDLDDEKFEQERQARIEYFRKLENYQVEKENVYVV